MTFSTSDICKKLRPRAQRRVLWGAVQGLSPSSSRPVLGFPSEISNPRVLEVNGRSQGPPLASLAFIMGRKVTATFSKSDRASLNKCRPGKAMWPFPPTCLQGHHRICPIADQALLYWDLPTRYGGMRDDPSPLMPPHRDTD